jgi:hypothetical protein
MRVCVYLGDVLYAMDMLEDGKHELPATQPRKHSDVLLHEWMRVWYTSHQA